jgi:lipopolysaccharide transport system ATP-binding protein
MERGIALHLPAAESPAALPAVLVPPVPEAGHAATEFAGVTIADASGTPKACFGHGEEIRITLDVAFHSANPAPCFGIQLKSADDIALWATTTAHMNVRLPRAEAGTRVRFAWALRANMGGARYVLALGVGDSASGEYRRHSRLAYAGHFDVLPEPRAGTGWLEPRATFIDERIGAAQRDRRET